MADSKVSSSTAPRPPRLSRLSLGEDELMVISFEPLGARVNDERLSRAEQQVASLVLQGLSSAEIASARGSAPRTIANQLASIFRKLDIASRAELASALDYSGR